jgi:hypothetical protein
MVRPLVRAVLELLQGRVFVVALQWAIRRMTGEMPVIDQFLGMCPLVAAAVSARG